MLEGVCLLDIPERWHVLTAQQCVGTCDSMACVL